MIGLFYWLFATLGKLKCDEVLFTVSNISILQGKGFFAN
jgi:hypothetical protein